MYDAIVVGARCAGSPTAMLLARRGHRVLLVDRATFPSDTLSTHVVHAPGVAALRRWGLLQQVVDTGCPPIETFGFDFGAMTLRGRVRPSDGCGLAYAPRRHLLDTVLVAGAAAAGVEVRQGVNVDGVLVEDGVAVGVRLHPPGGPAEELRARVVVGADGRHSHVARDVGTAEYHDLGRRQWAYYTYFRGLPVAEMWAYIRPGRGWGVAPTNAGETMVVLSWPIAEAAAFRADPEGNFLATLELAPQFAARVAAAERTAPFLGGAVENLFRHPYGPGWVLVGDAGYVRDPITAQGISDAFLDAEGVSAAVSAWLSGRAGYDDALGAWHAARDRRVRPMFEFTAQLATLEPPPPELARLLAAAAQDQQAADDFASVCAGTLSPAEFFAPDNVAAILSRVMARAGAPARAG
jgi:2-polyprenyl-6-methoxyphenol hydroxylase-like FAD-dependent oxidoreductase